MAPIIARNSFLIWVILTNPNLTTVANSTSQIILKVFKLPLVQASYTSAINNKINVSFHCNDK